MAMLLRKVFGSVSHRSGSSTGNQHIEMNSSVGEFDMIPVDIFIQILKILGPKESAKLRAVCKSWKFIISDNNLWMYFLQKQEQPWDSIFFAETYLRSRSPLQVFHTQAPDLSFMHIYGQRALVPGAIIIDGVHPLLDVALDIANMGGASIPLHLGGQQHFWNLETLSLPCLLDSDISFQQFAASLSSTILMQVKTSTQPMVVSLPLCHYDDTESAKGSRRQLKKAIYSALFDMNVPAVCAINQATLALFAARQTSGIVVNIGFHQTSVVPILHGKIMHKVGVEVIGIGALKLTGFLKEQMQQNNIGFQSLYTVRTLKEKLCYVALDYEAELSKDTRAAFQVPSEGWITLSKERFQTGEILFQPRIAGLQAMGLQQAVALCMDHCKDSEVTIRGDKNWYKTLVLAGGSACLPGLSERLEKEVCEYLPESMSSGIRVIPPPFGIDSAWFGAKVVSNLSTFTRSWCMTRRQFRHWSKRKQTW